MNWGIERYIVEHVLGWKTKVDIIRHIIWNLHLPEVLFVALTLSVYQVTWDEICFDHLLISVSVYQRTMSLIKLVAILV